jgi:hypothetical protein
MKIKASKMKKLIVVFTISMMSIYGCQQAEEIKNKKSSVSQVEEPQISKDSLDNLMKMVVDIDSKVRLNLDKINKSSFIGAKEWNGEYYNISAHYYMLKNIDDELIFLGAIAVDGEGWPMNLECYYFNGNNGVPIAHSTTNIDGQLFNDAYSKNINSKNLMKSVNTEFCIIGNKELNEGKLLSLTRILTDMSEGLKQNNIE